MQFTVKGTIVAGPDGAEGRDYVVTGTGTGEIGARCALKFNPGHHAPTEAVKVFCAGAMQAIADQRDQLKAQWDKKAQETEGKAPATYGPGEMDALRCIATALTHLETAQMFAVKGLHAVENAAA